MYNPDQILSMIHQYFVYICCQSNVIQAKIKKCKTLGHFWKSLYERQSTMIWCWLTEVFPLHKCSLSHKSCVDLLIPSTSTIIPVPTFACTLVGLVQLIVLSKLKTHSLNCWMLSVICLHMLLKLLPQEIPMTTTWCLDSKDHSLDKVSPNPHEGAKQPFSTKHLVKTYLDVPMAQLQLGLNIIFRRFVINFCHKIYSPFFLFRSQGFVQCSKSPGLTSSHQIGWKTTYVLDFINQNSSLGVNEGKFILVIALVVCSNHDLVKLMPVLGRKMDKYCSNVPSLYFSLMHKLLNEYYELINTTWVSSMSSLTILQCIMVCIHVITETTWVSIKLIDNALPLKLGLHEQRQSIFQTLQWFSCILIHVNLLIVFFLLFKPP